MDILASGPLRKMTARLENPVSYRLPVGDAELGVNELLGKEIAIHFKGQITCSNCGRASKKSFSQGYCYPCFKRLARCDTCIVSPEKCHYFEGSCREPERGDAPYSRASWTCLDKWS